VSFSESGFQLKVSSTIMRSDYFDYYLSANQIVYPQSARKIRGLLLITIPRMTSNILALESFNILKLSFLSTYNISFLQKISQGKGAEVTVKSAPIQGTLKGEVSLYN